MFDCSVQLSLYGGRKRTTPCRHTSAGSRAIAARRSVALTFGLSPRPDSSTSWFSLTAQSREHDGRAISRFHPYYPPRDMNGRPFMGYEPGRLDGHLLVASRPMSKILILPSARRPPSRSRRGRRLCLARRFKLGQRLRRDSPSRLSGRPLRHVQRAGFPVCIQASTRWSSTCRRAATWRTRRAGGSVCACAAISATIPVPAELQPGFSRDAKK